MKKEINTNKICINKYLICFVFFLLVVFMARVCDLCLNDRKVNDTTLSAFITKRNIKNEVIEPVRGSIYDVNGNILAQEVSSYTVIAYLDPKRSEGSSKILHVEDKEGTAKKLAPYINMSEEEVLRLLSKDNYQVELGPGGRNLSQIQMEEIKNLELPGIDFIKSSKRYYPNGDFASYAIGYTVKKDSDDGKITVKGELGIEEYFNDELTGKEGFKTYEKDRNGYKIANGREYIEDATNGDDIYLTIDSNIQLFIEKELRKTQEESEAEWVVTIVANAKTGAILGYASTPSFDPNIRNITSYLDPVVSNQYEPGSTMKIFSYMCALESGKYNGSDTFMSGSKTYTSQITNEEVTISDWNKTGWGEISYDQGFALSSNIGVANLLESVINKKDLKVCYEKYGFGKKTNITLKREYAGNIDFNYDIEAVTAGYGQGINTTPIQHIKALTILANNGNMVSPYLVSKIVDSNTNSVKYTNKLEVEKNVVSSETVAKMKELMRSVVQPDSKTATGYLYYMDGYDLIGKTGTAQIYDNSSNKYTDTYIYSFSGLYPGEEPEIIVYTAIKKPKDNRNYIASMVKEIIVNTSKYLNIEKESSTTSVNILESYIGKKTSDVTSNLNGSGIKYIVLGDGDKIINQYPSSGVSITKTDNVILLTNKYDKTIPDITGMSYKEVKVIFDLLNISYTYTGYGYLDSYIVKEDGSYELTFKPKF